MPYDGPEIFLAPYGNSEARTNFENTVVDGVPRDELSTIADELPETGDIVYFWGTHDGNDGSWQSVSPGDYLVFYRDGEYTHAAKVLGTEQNEEVGERYWPNFDDDPWDRIMYIDSPNEINVSSDIIHDLAGDDINYTMGFRPLNEMGIGGLRGKYGSIEAFAEGGAAEDVDVQTVPDFNFSDSILDGLHFPDERGREILDQVESAFDSGKHVIFTGPPGTGKTEIARRVAKELQSSHPDNFSGYQLTTATASWSTFETVGGYMPSEKAEADDLSFEPGQVLRRFKRDGQQLNEILVIDEINRADIDKAFGPLFTLLSGQAVQLPYRLDGKEIVVEPAAESSREAAAHEYVMPESWRLMATMNTYDKTSLYELSYAFMRRFSFIYVEAPTVPQDPEAQAELVREYAREWEMDVSDENLEVVGRIWHVMNSGGGDRKIGPAVVADMLSAIENGSGRNRQTVVTSAIANYVLPQLEGEPRRKSIVERLSRIDDVDQNRLAALGEDVLQIQIDG